MKKTAAFLLALLTAVVFGGCSVEQFRYDFENAEKYVSGEQSFPADITELDIDWVDGSVNVVYYDGDTVELSEEAERTIPDGMETVTRLDNGVLCVRYCKPGTWRFGTGSPQKRLTVKVPQGTELAKLTIGSVSGDVSSEVASADAELNAVSGSIKATISAKDARIGTTSGDMELVFSAEEVSLELSAVSGRIAAALRSGKLKADTTSGSIRIAAERLEGEIGTTSGGVEVTAERLEGEISTTSGEVEVAAEQLKGEISTASGRVGVEAARLEGEISTTSGDVRLTLPETGDFTIGYSTSSGDIESMDIPMILSGKSLVCGKGTDRIEISTTSGDLAIRKK